MIISEAYLSYIACKFPIIRKNKTLRRLARYLCFRPNKKAKEYLNGSDIAKYLRKRCRREDDPGFLPQIESAVDLCEEFLEAIDKGDKAYFINISKHLPDMLARAEEDRERDFRKMTREEKKPFIDMYVSDAIDAYEEDTGKKPTYASMLRWLENESCWLYSDGVLDPEEYAGAGNENKREYLLRDMLKRDGITLPAEKPWGTTKESSV